MSCEVLPSHGPDDEATACHVGFASSSTCDLPRHVPRQCGQDIVHDDDDRTRLLADLERTVLRCDWRLLAFVVMGNHLHLLIKTPRPNLARGMQAFLSAYALWAARRRRRPGHLFQGRYKAEMIAGAGVRLGDMGKSLTRSDRRRAMCPVKSYPPMVRTMRPPHAPTASPRIRSAIYHVMTRGNARQDIVHDDDDRTRLLTDLERTVLRCGWECWPSSSSATTSTSCSRLPGPTSPEGMQAFLSGYACGRRGDGDGPGHLFQGRYKAEMIEDESYYWTVSRYIHLNPVRAGLVARPEDWEWSSYPGYVAARATSPLGRYETCWPPGGATGREDAAGAYRRYVEAGLADPPESPFRETFGGWVLGSRGFVERLRALAVRRPPIRRCARHVNWRAWTPGVSWRR